MKRRIFLLLLAVMILTGTIPAQKISHTQNSHGLQSPAEGYQRLSTRERDETANHENGKMIYNTTINAVQVNLGTAARPRWQTLIGYPRQANNPNLSNREQGFSLNCSGAVHQGKLIWGVQADTTVKTMVSYTGGTQGAYTTIQIPSTGINGLTAVLVPGVSTTTGNLQFNIIGTPQAAGLAMFTFTFRGITCSFNRIVEGPKVNVLDCSIATPATSYFVAGVPMTRPLYKKIGFDGGNSAAFPAMTIQSSGITGLTATLAPGKMDSEKGELLLILTGTPIAAGNATFRFLFGEKSCSFSIPVYPVPAIAAIDCSSIITEGVFNPGFPQAGKVTLRIKYTGGNGGAYNLTQFYTDLPGLGFMLAPGVLANGNGELILSSYGGNLQGAPDLVNFNFSFGGRACTIPLRTGCGGVIAPGVWKMFMCHNLGAFQWADALDPSFNLNGDYYQWGKKVKAASAPTQNDPMSGPVNEWNTTEAADGAWGPQKTTSDPCPAGYRVPTYNEMNGLINNNPYRNTGPWVTSTTNYSSGKYWGNHLYLPNTGSRWERNGELISRGFLGAYWTSQWGSRNNTGNKTATGMYQYQSPGTYSNTGVVFASYPRNTGMAVRCIKE